jgi:hypothetical protein
MDDIVNLGKVLAQPSFRLFLPAINVRRAENGISELAPQPCPVSDVVEI